MSAKSKSRCIKITAMGENGLLNLDWRATMKVYCLLALLLVCVPAMVHAADEGLKVGDAAPDFEMQGSDGKVYKLADFKGKKAFVIAWFPKAFTGG